MEFTGVFKRVLILEFYVGLFLDKKLNEKELVSGNKFEKKQCKVKIACVKGILGKKYYSSVFNSNLIVRYKER